MMDVGRKTKMEKTTVKHMSTAQMTVTALMTAITCILAPMALPIPISPVPISLTNLVIFFMAYILGMKLSVASYVLYLLLGTVGLPVFSGFSGGVGKLLGPTGGYLIGFIFLAAIAGFFVEKFPASVRKFFIVGWAGLRLCGTGKNQVTYLQVGDGAAVRAQQVLCLLHQHSAYSRLRRRDPSPVL